MSLVKCAACGYPGKDTMYIFRTTRGKDFPFCKCPRCGAFYINERYSPVAELGSAIFTTYGRKEAGIQIVKGKQHLYLEVVMAVCNTLKYDHKKEFWLDINCSFGGLAEFIHKNGYTWFDIEASDFLTEAVEYTRSLGIVTYQAKHVKDISLNNYDIISVIDANCYWHNQPHELWQIRERLNHGGIMVMRVSNKTWLADLATLLLKIHPRLARKLFWKAINDHRFSMPLRSLIKVVKQSGFKHEATYIRNAYYSDNTPLGVRISFYLGSIFKRFAPGAIVIFRKK